MGKKNPNYDFKKQKEPSRRMGEGDYQNLPQSPFVRPFPKDHPLKSGITNSFTSDLSVLSGIDENGV
jgi:hypothetical protein